MSNLAQDTLHILKTGQIDFEGQKLSHNILKASTWVVAIVCTFLAYVFNTFSIVGYGIAAVTVFNVLVVLPPWPCYRRNPAKFHVSRNISKRNKTVSNLNEDSSDDE